MELTQALVVGGLLDPDRDFSGLDWLPLHPGVDIHDLYPESDDGARAALLRYHPGAVVPWHLHGGYEHILVLQGAQQDDHGRYEKGTLVINPPGTTHRVSSEEGCIVLAVWQRPVQLLARKSGE